MPDKSSQASKTWTLSLQTKVMLIFLVLALGPLLIIGRFSLIFTEELIASMVIRQLDNVAVDKVAILERWLEERKADLKVAAGTTLLKTMNAEMVTPYLDLVRKKYGVYKELTVVSADGKIISNSREGPRINDNTGSKRYVVRQELFISDITYASDEMESSFLIAAPIVGDDGQFAGTVYGRVGTNKIIIFILNVSLGETGECYLVDKDGRFLAHKEPHRILSQNISQSDSFRKIFEKRDRKKSYHDYRGVEVLGVSLKIGGTDWYVVVEQDREEAFQSAANLKRIIYLTVLLCIASALMLTWMISYHMLGPIRKLSEYAGLIANSQSPGTIGEIHRRDEIGLLYRA
ncbi:MAG: HAMP domain-containing protein, partial [Desulfobacteraceae bacterium]